MSPSAAANSATDHLTPARAAPGRRPTTMRLLPWFIVLLQLGWWSYGVWPIVPLEGDDQGVMFGVEGMVRGDPVLGHMRYLYEVQPGAYHVLARLTRLTGASIQTVFGCATIAGAAAFALAGAWLLRTLLAWPLAWTLVAMLWCQEVTAAACYANTSALAGGAAILAVLLASRPERLAWLWSGLVLALAGWLRADSLLVAPACLGLAYWRQAAWGPAALRTLAIAATAAAGVAGLYWLSGASLQQGFETYAGRGYFLSGWRTLAETPALLLSPVLAVSTLIGSGLLLRRRAYGLGLVVISGLLPSLVAYGTSLSTPKYLYYVIPFALLPGLDLLGGLGRKMSQLPRRFAWLAGLGVVGVLLADGLVGLRTLQPAERYFTTSPTLTDLFQIKTRTKTFGLVVGPGELLINADGFRLRAGQWFAPGCWHREKSRMQTELATLHNRLADGYDLTLYWSGWLPYQMARRELLATGFRPADLSTFEQTVNYQGDWCKLGRVVHLSFLGYIGSPYQAPGLAPAGSTSSDTYFIGDGARRPVTELADGRRWQLVSTVPEGFISLYQRR